MKWKQILHLKQINNYSLILKGSPDSKRAPNGAIIIPNITDVSYMSSSVIQDYGASRCDTRSALQSNGCPQDYIEYPVSDISFSGNQPLSDKGSGGETEKITQMTPQKIELYLRPGKGTFRYRLSCCNP